MKTLLIFGAGGHGRVVADAALLAGAWSRVIATDRDPRRCAGELLPGVPLLPPEEAIRQADVAHVAIGDAASRQREAQALAALPLVTIVHPKAAVASYVLLEDGVFVAAQAVVAPRAMVGRATIVNHGAVVDHDVKVGNFCHVAPLVALGGGVHVGDRVLLGSGTCVLPGMRIASDLVIGAGALVREHLAQPGRYAGVPARRLA